MPKPRRKNINKICAEVASSFTHADNVSYETMYNLLKQKYGGELPATPNVLRLCVRHDKTNPPYSAKHMTFSEFLKDVIGRQEKDSEEFHGKWKLMIDGKKTTVKSNDLTRKMYALLMYNDRWKRCWKTFPIRPFEETNYTEFDYKLGSYLGAWADYEGC